MKSKNLDDLLLFIKVVKTGSLAAAGRDLALSSAVVTKRIQRLEENIGVLLLNRSTRKLSLTDEGTIYYDVCLRVVTELQEAETLIAQGSRKPSGTLRITVPAAFGRLHVAPLVPEFLSRYPDVRLVLHLSDQCLNLIDEGYDLAVRIGELHDSSLVTRVLATDRRILVASPDYVARHGAPQSPEDVARHNALLFASAGPVDHWNFIGRDGNRVSVRPVGNLETNNCDALRAAILAGLGIALRPLWDIWNDLAAGRMVALLRDYRSPSFPIQAVYPTRRHLPQKTRLFIDLLVERFGNVPYWDNATEAPGGGD